MNRFTKYAIAAATLAAGGLDARALCISALTPELLRLNVGIFVLHMVQMAMFLVLQKYFVRALTDGAVKS